MLNFPGFPDVKILSGESKIVHELANTGGTFPRMLLMDVYLGHSSKAKVIGLTFEKCGESQTCSLAQGWCMQSLLLSTVLKTDYGQTYTTFAHIAFDLVLLFTHYMLSIFGSKYKKCDGKQTAHTL